MNDQNDIGGYVPMAAMRAILKNEGCPMSKSTFWRYVKKNRVPTRKAANVLMVPGALVYLMVMRDKGRA
jgi:hypothetical protein